MTTMPRYYDDLVTDYGHFSNHGNLEDDDEAVKTILGYVDSGYLHSFDTGHLPLHESSRVYSP